MSNPIEDGGTAFPVNVHDRGMTLRDYFAAKAMNSILGSISGIQPDDLPLMARDCYGIADAMLKAREGL